MKQLTQPRQRASAQTRDERGSALVTVLILIVVLTMIGAAMLTVTLTEITIAFNHADAAIARDLAEAGLARSANDLRTNLAWPGTGGAIAEGDGTYDVTVTSSGSTRYILSTGIRGGGRQTLRGGLKAIPRSAVATVISNTTATVGSGTPGLTVSNTMPSAEAIAVHANNRLGAGTAMTVNAVSNVIIGGLTSNGSISGAACATWPWRCDTAFPTIPFPRLDADSAAATSLKNRAKNTLDTDGRNLYFRGGDATSRCMSGGAWNFGAAETQRCWDKYVSDRAGIIGTGIAGAVFFAEFNSGEQTRYTTSGSGGITFRGATSASTGATSLTISKPAGVVNNDVMVAAISHLKGSDVTITAPAGWTLVRRINNGTNIALAVYRKVAASEGASYTWTFSNSGDAQGGIQAYSGVDTTAPVNVENGQATPDGFTHSTPSVTTTVANTMLVTSFAIKKVVTWSPPAGETERYDVASGGATSEGNDELQATAGATGIKTATATDKDLGATHILALRPGAGATTVDCVGYSTAVETLCLRSRAATDSNNTVVYPNSDLRQVAGTIVVFRRGSGTSTVGTVVLESLSLRTSNYTHTSLGGDPALVAGGRFEVISSGAPAATRTVDITGIVYTFAGADNPDVNGNLLGSAAAGIDVQHGANLVTLAFHGFMVSNGSIALRDTATNSGIVSVLYDAVVADSLPAVFTASSTDNVIFSISWSSGD